MDARIAPFPWLSQGSALVSVPARRPAASLTSQDVMGNVKGSKGRPWPFAGVWAEPAIALPRRRGLGTR